MRPKWKVSVIQVLQVLQSKKRGFYVTVKQCIYYIYTVRVSYQPWDKEFYFSRNKNPCDIFAIDKTRVWIWVQMIWLCYLIITWSDIVLQKNYLPFLETKNGSWNN